MESESAPVQTYVYECLDKDPHRGASVDLVHRDYSVWCVEQGLIPLEISDSARPAGGRAAGERKRRRDGDCRQYYYFGVTIKRSRLKKVDGKEVLAYGVV